MEILITGGAGFIGSHVAEYYYSESNKITVIDNLSRSRLLNKDQASCDQNWNRILKQYPNIELLKIDVRDHEKLDVLFKNHSFDTIFHMAGQTAITSSIKNPREDFENNMVGSFNILESARKNCDKPKIVFCSTNKVFGANPNNIPIIETEKRYIFKDTNFLGIDENFNIDHTIHTPYGTSKLASDLYMQEYAQTYGLKTGIFRMSCIYGPNQISFEDQGWIVHIIKKSIQDKSVNIFGDGKQVRDILYVTDLIDLYDRFIKNKSIGSEIFCAGGGIHNTISILELLDIVEYFTKIEIKKNFFDWREGDQKLYVSDFSKAKRILGWEPKINPEQGIEELINQITSDMPIK